MHGTPTSPSDEASGGDDITPTTSPKRKLAACRQNAGPAGVTLVIARRDFLAQAREDIPAVFSYKTHLNADSLYNTPPVFAIYVVGLVLKWIETQGGVR